MKKHKKVCETCKHHVLTFATYREECRKDSMNFILSDEIINWIMLFGCGSWIKE